MSRARSAETRPRAWPTETWPRAVEAAAFGARPAEPRPRAVKLARRVVEPLLFWARSAVGGAALTRAPMAAAGPRSSKSGRAASRTKRPGSPPARPIGARPIGARPVGRLAVGTRSRALRADRSIVATPCLAPWPSRARLLSASLSASGVLISRLASMIRQGSPITLCAPSARGYPRLLGATPALAVACVFHKNPPLRQHGP